MTQRHFFRRKSNLLIALAIAAINGVPERAYSVNKSNSCEAIFQSDGSARFTTRFATAKIQIPLLGNSQGHPFKLTIDSPNGPVMFDATNPYLTEAFNVRPEAYRIVNVLNARTPEEQASFDRKLTMVMGEEYGMSFKDKKGRPFHVNINGAPAVIPLERFNAFVRGLEPVLGEMERILQIFKSNPDAPPEAYGFKHLSPEQVRTLVKELNGPYFDRAAVHEVLKKYKFVSIVGADAVFGMRRFLAEIFEINAGTPSGFSNLTMILEALRVKDPDMFRAVMHDLAHNEAFEKLRQTMDEHGRYWMRVGGNVEKPSGLSVELGAGIFNGAHPDIAMMSHFSGMPLVTRGDMFIDRDGFLRMANKLEVDSEGFYYIGGRRVRHVGSHDYLGYVQVWSIYSRSEEGNAIQENTRDGKKGIGIKIPNLEEVNNRLNAEDPSLHLQTAVAYRYKRNQKTGEITGVHLRNGEPEVEANFEQFADDPVDKRNKQKSLVKSIHKGRVYLSNFGTRLIDNKGILSLVIQEVEGRLRDNGQDPENLVVGPPKELRTAEERKLFFAMPRNFVVKVTSESGGVGVYILPTATDAEVAKVVEMVRANPESYVIQPIASFMSYIGIAENIETGKKFETRAFDGRVFVFKGPDGKTSSDPFAMLIRVAKDGKLSTNTSQGAEYGLAVVAKGKDQRAYTEERSTLPPGKTDFLTNTQLFHLKDYLLSMDITLSKENSGKWLVWANHKKNKQMESARFKADPEKEKTTKFYNFLANFWNSARTLMPVLGPQYSYMIDAIEKTQRGEMDVQEFMRITADLEQKLLVDHNLPQVVQKSVAAFAKGKALALDEVLRVPQGVVEKNAGVLQQQNQLQQGSIPQKNQ